MEYSLNIPIQKCTKIKINKMGFIDSSTKNNLWCVFSTVFGVAVCVFIFIFSPDPGSIGQPGSKSQPFLILGVVMFFVSAAIMYFLVPMLINKSTSKEPMGKILICPRCLIELKKNKAICPECNQRI